MNKLINELNSIPTLPPVFVDLVHGFNLSAHVWMYILCEIKAQLEHRDLFL